MEQRPASRTVTAYARGLYLAQVFQLAVAGITILTVIIGAYFLNEQRKTMAGNDQKIELQSAQLVALREESSLRTEINQYLSRATVALSDASPDDPFIAGLAYNRAFEELQGALETVPEAAAGPGDDPWHETRQSLLRMMAGTLTSARRFPEAISFQQQLIGRDSAGSPEWARSNVGLASLYCRAGEKSTAMALLTADFREAHGNLLADAAFIDACGVVETRDSPASPGDTDQRAPAALRRLFLHIRTEEQRRAAANLAERLCARGFTVEGIERVPPPRGYPATPRAIYYYPDQAGDAATVSLIVESEIAALGLTEWRRPFEARLYQGDNLPRDQVEIWFAETGGAFAGLGQGVPSCRPVLSPEQQMNMLIADLNARSQETRLTAGQQVADALRGERKHDVAAGLIRELETPQLENLTATGRFNILFLLNGVTRWDDPAQAARLSAALADMESRAAAPGSTFGIGGQTRDCIDALKTRLAGGDAPDRCGGR